MAGGLGLAQEHGLGQLQNLYQHQVLQSVYYVKIYTFLSYVYKCLPECKYCKMCIQCPQRPEEDTGSSWN